MAPRSSCWWLVHRLLYFRRGLWRHLGALRDCDIPRVCGSRLSMLRPGLADLEMVVVKEVAV